jgi:16S rRNA (guanine966-N2)-methyltransferase
MRITGGSARGQILKVPKDIRPTTDMTREAIFSMLVSMGSGEWENVLDLFSGTGALGIESLSRGANWVDFIEKEPRCCDIIKQNLERMGFSDVGHVYCRQVLKELENLEKQYDLVLMDPPYADKSLETVLDKIGNSNKINENSLVVLTHSSRVNVAGNYGKLALIKSKRHGDTTISIYKTEAN